MKYIDEKERKEKSKEWQSTLILSQQSEKKAQAKREDVSSNAMKLLVKSNTEPALPVTQMNSMLGLSTTEGLQARKELIDRGYVIERKMIRKGSGGPLKVLEVGGKGIEALLLIGMKPHPKLVTRSQTWKHSIGYPCWIKRHCQRNGMQVWFERKMGDLWFDSVIGKEGKLSGVEICLGASGREGIVEYNVKKAVTAVREVQGIVELLMAFEDLALLRRVEKGVKEALSGSPLLSKVACISLGVFGPA